MNIAAQAITQLEYFLLDEQATLKMGEGLAQVCSVPCIIFLQGQLGMGKTTLTRGFIQGLGVRGTVKSPTFTLVEPYDLVDKQVFHFDLYRMNEPEELEYIGIRDYFAQNSICLIEWPERGQGILPAADLICQLSLHSAGRLLNLYAHTELGNSILQKLNR
ncbi:MAG: tsaE [Gammaproteobacteria bacterium]|nr:tsaE [Gammaproteobacteria bacterium]